MAMGLAVRREQEATASSEAEGAVALESFMKQDSAKSLRSKLRLDLSVDDSERELHDGSASAGFFGLTPRAELMAGGRADRLPWIKVLVLYIYILKQHTVLITQHPLTAQHATCTPTQLQYEGGFVPPVA